MDLRNPSSHLSPAARCDTRRRMIEEMLDFDLSALTIDPQKLGHAEERNCEQMFGHVPIPVGYAGPLPVTFSSGKTADIHLPLATTEGALVASANRGCKALRMSGGVRTTSVYHGVSRSMAFRIKNLELRIKNYYEKIQRKEREWKSIGEATSSHLKILKYDMDTKDDYIFLTIYADTDEAMGMNMVTIATEAIGKWLAENLNVELVTVAANVDSDKKPSQRTHDRGRGYEVTATATVTPEILYEVLKTTPEQLIEVAHAKLDLGSNIAGAIGHNCHAANIIAALYLATGQDPAHVVEGSLADTKFSIFNSQFSISTRLPALLVGIRGGGTTLPAQQQCLSLLIHPLEPSLPAGKAGTQPFDAMRPSPRARASESRTVPNGDLRPRLLPCRRLAESIGAAVLAGEISLLAALASNNLAGAHQSLGRGQMAKTVQKGQTYDTVPSC